MTQIDMSGLPVTLIIKNEKTDPIELPLDVSGGGSTGIVLEPGTYIKYEVTTSAEYLYYYQACKQMGLSLEEDAGSAVNDSAGNVMKEALVIDELPITYIITNNGTDAIELPIFNRGIKFVINPEEELTYLANTASEAIFYYQACKQLGLSLEEKVTTPSGDEEEGGEA